ncbi:MAG: tetratricopeptide repeat protein [Pseudomonadota bacterium]
MDYFDVGPFTRPVTTAVPEAQTWFDRGINWLYGFGHEEAIACFQKAAEADPGCAMAYWGISYAAGPNYNLPWHLYDPAGKAAALGAAYDAMKAAEGAMAGATPVEQALIGALGARYPQREPVDDMRPWDKAYTTAMRSVFEAYGGDREVRTVFVEAMMNETPWKMWDLATAQPNPKAKTEEAMAVLEEAFAEDPAAWDHPGLLHLHVHLMEMSPFPERALRTGDRLRVIAPELGHLVHMPTHIDVLCGHYRDVLYWNQKAIEADRKFLAERGALNVYALYRTHNHHFAIYGAMFLGQYTPALAAAQELIDTTPEEVLRIESPPMADFTEAYLAMKQHVLVRFGKWREIIAQEEPADKDLYCSTVSMMRYAKGVAYSALGMVAEAEAARDAFMEAKSAQKETRLVHNNTVVDLLEIASAMLDGELEYRKGNYDEAFAHLRRAVSLDDALPYDEPWGWMQPARHALGALLLEQGEVAEAEAVYRADLGLDGTLSRACQHPDNLWSLHGLHACLVRQGRTAEALPIKQRLDLAAARAEIPIKASCFCSQQAMAAE